MISLMDRADYIIKSDSMRVDLKMARKKEKVFLDGKMVRGLRVFTIMI